jgi:hypothetical protein
MLIRENEGKKEEKKMLRKRTHERHVKTKKKDRRKEERYVVRDKMNKRHVERNEQYGIDKRDEEI